MTLGTDTVGRVTAATFNAYDENGKQLFANPNTINLYNLQTTAHTPVGVEDLSPILAVQVSLVGNNTGRTVLSSGAGTITYQSLLQPFIGAQEPPWVGPQTLIPQWPEPTSLGFQGGTYEQANSVYADTLSGDDAFGLVQQFGVVTHTAGQALAATRQFGTTNRTDVFAIGSTGQLTMFYVEDSGAWSMHAPIGPGSFPPTGSTFAPPGAQLAVSQQFGISNRTDVFVVDNTGTLNFFYCDNGDVKGWQGPIAISAAGFAPPGAHLAACQRAANANQTDVYLVDHTGTLQVFSVVGSGNWSKPVTISAEDFAPAGAAVAASPRYGVTDQTDVYRRRNVRGDERIFGGQLGRVEQTRGHQPAGVPGAALGNHRRRAARRRLRPDGCLCDGSQRPAHGVFRGCSRSCPCLTSDRFGPRR